VVENEFGPAEVVEQLIEIGELAAQPQFLGIHAARSRRFFEHGVISAG
jgi:hypothetical protein